MVSDSKPGRCCARLTLQFHPLVGSAAYDLDRVHIVLVVISNRVHNVLGVIFQIGVRTGIHVLRASVSQ